MAVSLDDLLCPTCRSYVHVFLDHCPACGAARSSRYPDATVGDGQSVAVALAPSTAGESVLAAASIAMRRHMLTSRGRGLGVTAASADPETGVDVADLFNRIAGAIRYRGVPGPGKQVQDVALRVVEGDLRLEASGKRSVVAAVPLGRILSVTPVARAGRGLPAWSGILEGRGGAVPPRPPADASCDLLIVHASEYAFVDLPIANRGGLFASTARPDHYEELARWLGLLAAVGGARRADEVGPARYAEELGLRPSPRAGSSGASPSSTAAALRELEELRLGGLVTEAEYAHKRAEILERL